jgi:hypothetical protein
LKNQLQWKIFQTNQNPSGNLQNRRVASDGVIDGFDSHSLPPFCSLLFTENINSS